MEKPSTWYVYTYAFSDDTVFYVGKGKDNRINQHEVEAASGCDCRKCTTIRKIWESGKPVKKRIVFETLVEREALVKESELIQQYAGSHLTNGGPAHVTGLIGKDGHSVRWGKELPRLTRLSKCSGKSPGEIARQSIIEYELVQPFFRDTVRDATLALIQACVPDEMYNPSDDPRQEDAVRHLGELLNSTYAAEGIQLALMQIVNQGEVAMDTTYRETSTEPDTFYIDQIEQGTIPVIEEIGGSIAFDETVERIDGHHGRYRVVLPAGCTYVGQTAGVNPQIVTLPGGRRLCIIPGQVDVRLQFLAGDSSDPSHWNGAQRIPDEEEVNQ